MVRYLLGRLLQGLVVLLVTATAVFVIFRVVPGDPAAITLGFDSSPEAREALRAEMGLDQPLAVQYRVWIGNLLRGDLGRSITHGNAPVASVVFPALWKTVELAAVSMAFSLLIAIPLGLLAAIRAGTRVDQVIRVVTTLGFSMPTYVLGIALLILLAQVFPVLPSGGYVPFRTDPTQHLKLLVLPVATVGLVMSARLARFMRAGMLDVLNQDYIRTAYAKGLPSSRVNYVHGLRNGSLALVTEVGVNFGLLIGGMVVIEQIFTWPGLGWLMIQSVLNRAYDVVQAAVLVSAAVFVGINLMVDLLYSVLDPRISQHKRTPRNA
jgi:peptide/nickel transport system permease protein